MRDVIAVWRAQRRVRWFCVAQAQGALGDGAGYVALLLLAYERIGSAWAATAVALADLVPAMLLAPALGALADRHGRVRCAIAADVIRAVAFTGLLFTHSTATMVALAVLAGTGTALFRPATGALLPSLTTDEWLPAASALQGMVRDGGQLLGPALAAALLTAVSPDAVLGLNAATFAISALLLTRLGGEPARASNGDAAVDAASGGVRAMLSDVRVRALVITSGAVALAAGTLNVAELVLAQHDLAAGGTGYGLMISVYGLGLCAGSALAAKRPRHLAAIALLVAGMLGTAVAPNLALVLITFAITGAGNGLFIVSNRVMLQRQVPDRLHGRAFGLATAVDSWALGGAVLAGGALVSSFGARPAFALSAAALVLAGLLARHVLDPAPARPTLALAAT